MLFTLIGLTDTEQIPKRIRADRVRQLFVYFAAITIGRTSVTDDRADAVTVMIGDDPYTLGLFDTAGQSCSAQADATMLWRGG